MFLFEAFAIVVGAVTEFPARVADFGVVPFVFFGASLDARIPRI
jgi:hypothetical protein